MPPSATRPPVIQICPPYLEEIKNSKYRTLGDLGSGGMLAVSQEALAGKLGPVKISRSPMNIIMLFDSILLHEMTHAISTPPGTIDVGGYSGAYGNIIETPSFPFPFPLIALHSGISKIYLKTASRKYSSIS